MPKRQAAFDPTDIFHALNAADVRYLVVGGIAVVLYGISRTTFDVDLSVHLMKDFEAVYRRRKMATLRGVPVPLIPVNELARMKRKAGRPQDLQDVQDLRLAGRIP